MTEKERLKQSSTEIINYSESVIRDCFNELKNNKKLDHARAFLLLSLTKDLLKLTAEETKLKEEEENKHYIKVSIEEDGVLLDVCADTESMVSAIALGMDQEPRFKRLILDATKNFIEDSLKPNKKP